MNDSADVFETVRVPASFVDARERYGRDPMFVAIVDAAARRYGFEPTDLLSEAVGRRIRATKTLIGTATEPAEWVAEPRAEVVEWEEDE